MMMMMPELPEDLVEEILCRIPATSLKRFRSTCKRWNLLFNDRRFIRKQHFHKSPRQSMILMLKKFVFYSMSINPHGVPTVDITGKLNLIKCHSSFDQFRKISQLSQSDGLVICVLFNFIEVKTRLVVLNPCTGQAKWIQHKKPNKIGYIYTLGSYQDSKSGNNSYKILSHRINGDPDFEIYESNSNSWRILDVTRDCNILYRQNVSLKGKTYWFARDEREKQLELGLFLTSFDYTREKFERQGLPYQGHGYRNMSLSVVRDQEKLSVLLQQRESTSKTEIWVSNKIGETKVLSWIKVLAVDLKPDFRFGVTFLVDEEKKVLMYTQYTKHKGQHMLYIDGEDKGLMGFGGEGIPYLFHYVPSLTQI